MTSPPLPLRLQADSPINRNALTMTRPARAKQLRFFKFFPPPRTASQSYGVNPRRCAERKRSKNRFNNNDSSLRWRSRWSFGFRCGRLVLRRRNAGILQRLVQGESYFVRRHGSIQFPSTYKHRRSCVHSDCFSLMHRSAHGLLILRLDASLQFRNVEVMFLSLQSGQFIEFRILAVAAFFAANRLLIAVQVIGVVPVGVTALRAQAIGVHRRMHSPWVNFLKRVVLVDEEDAISVLLEKAGKKC